MQSEQPSARPKPAPGFAQAGERDPSISYPEEGHDTCYGVEDASFWFRHRNDCIAALVRRYPPPAGTALLDIGGGNGFVSQRLLQEGHDVALLEPGSAGARNAQLRRGLPNVLCATLEDAGFAAGSFGAAGLFDVIEHVENDRAFLLDVRELLSPGGRLYLSVPCHSWLWSGADAQAGHYRRHTLGTLADLLGKGFRIEYATYFFAPLVLPQFLLRALPYRLGRGRRNAVLSPETEHGTGDGPLVRAMERLLRPEVRRIANGRQIRFGASALLAATKSPD